MPCSSSCAHAFTCASWAACTRSAWVGPTTDGRSKELSWVTAIPAVVRAGGSTRGRITVASRTVQTMTARNSGSNPLRSYLEVALPLGRCSGLSSERERSGGTAQERRSENLHTKQQFFVGGGAD